MGGVPLSSKNWNVIGSAALIAIFLSFTVGDIILSHPQAKALHLEVLREFHSIAAPTGAVQKYPSDNHSLLRNHQGSVGAEYYTHESESDIRRYYDRELEVKGWRLVAVKDWDKEREVFFCKPPLYASLEFLGDIPASERSSEKFAYAFQVSWGARPGELKGKCD
jgi:hypothetical protein